MWGSYSGKLTVFGLCRGNYLKPVVKPASYPYGRCNVNNEKQTAPLSSGDYMRFMKTVPNIDTTSWEK
jgi:hypothetical protein